MVTASSSLSMLVVYASLMLKTNFQEQARLLKLVELQLQLSQPVGSSLTYSCSHKPTLKSHGGAVHVSSTILVPTFSSVFRMVQHMDTSVNPAVDLSISSPTLYTPTSVSSLTQPMSMSPTQCWSTNRTSGWTRGEGDFYK